MDKKTVIALGFFDGVHAGHASLMQRAAERAAEKNMEPVVVSFDVHPDTLVFGTKVPLINSARDREDIVYRSFGIERVVLLHFSRTVMQTPWDEFLSSLIEELNAGHIVAGYDFTFGSRGEGNAEKLSAYCAGHSIGCDIMPAVMLEGGVVSSTRIRACLEQGDIPMANRLLGHPYFLSDTVHPGFHLGRKLGSPTINMYYPDNVLVPRRGVYAARAVFEDGSFVNAVTNIGTRPTVTDSDAVSVESHLLGFSGDLYGRHVRLDFYAFLRPEQKFESFELLSAQIKKDTAAAEEFFAGRA